MRYAAMAPSILTQRLCLQLRDECDAEWNHELLGEHEGWGGRGSNPRPTDSLRVVLKRPRQDRLILSAAMHLGPDHSRRRPALSCRFPFILGE